MIITFTPAKTPCVNIEIYEPKGLIGPRPCGNTSIPGVCASCVWFVPEPEAADKANLSLHNTFYIPGVCLYLFPAMVQTASNWWCPCYNHRPDEFTDNPFDPVVAEQDKYIQEHIIHKTEVE